MPEPPTARLNRPQLSSSYVNAPAPRLLSAGGSSAGGIQLVLVTVMGLALLALLAAVSPAWALPRQVGEVLDGRREAVAFATIGVLLAFLIALLIAHGGS